MSTVKDEGLTYSLTEDGTDEAWPKPIKMMMIKETLYLSDATAHDLH
jgi:hypothetical protein